MSDPATPPHSPTHPLEMILRLCAAADPEPWYPRDYAAAAGINRDQLDPFLERLRLAGLVRLTDWVKDHGQGYVLTPEGKQTLESPWDLAQLSNGRMPSGHPTPEPVAGPEVHREDWDRGGRILADLQRPQTPVVTNVLLAINVVWFLAGLVLAQQQGLAVSQYMEGPSRANGVGLIAHQIGDLSGADLLRGQWWRLLTCCFVHYGVMHIGVNMLTLLMVGPMLERMWGRWRLLAIYLISGWGGSCIVMIVDPRTKVAGASGALWGIVASAAVWILLNRAYLPRELSSAWLRNLFVAFLLNAFISMGPNISASAHFGGGAVGAVAGVLANLQRFGAAGRRRLGLAGLALLPGLCTAALAGDMAIKPRWQQLRLIVEDNDFKRDAGDPVISVGNTAGTTFDEEIFPLIRDYRFSRRDPKDVEKARGVILRQQADLEQVAAQLKNAGPYRTGVIEQARQAGLAYIEGLIELYRKADICLRVAEQEKQHEKELIAQVRQVVGLRRAWIESLRRIRQMGESLNLN